MSEHNSDALDHNSDSDDGSYEAFENEILSRIPTLPLVIQEHIARLCDLPTRGALCLLNRDWHARTMPLLWRYLDFDEAFDSDALVEATRHFFLACEAMLESSSERFAKLAANVQMMSLGRMHGIYLVDNEWPDAGDFPYFESPNPEEHRMNIFDIIAHFHNLADLTVYVKNWWGFSSDRRETGRALATGLTKLKSLKIGGEMPSEVLNGLLARPARLEDLTLVNLIASPGQDSGPEGTAFLTEAMCSRFKNLRTLHLCKLADLDGRLSKSDDENDEDEDDHDLDDDNSDDSVPNYASGIRWKFPRDSEVKVLEDWALLLRHTSRTLRTVTLENRFLVSWGFVRNNYTQIIDPGNAHPSDWGANSFRESQRVLFPVLLEQEWPQLEKMTLVGMGPPDAVSLSLSGLQAQAIVEQRPASLETMGGDATPEQISTPAEFVG